MKKLKLSVETGQVQAQILKPALTGAPENVCVVSRVVHGGDSPVALTVFISP